MTNIRYVKVGIIQQLSNSQLPLKTVCFDLIDTIRCCMQNIAKLICSIGVGSPLSRVQRVGVFNFGTDRVRVLEKA